VEAFIFPDKKPPIIYISTIPNDRYLEVYDDTVVIHTKHQEDSIIHRQELKLDARGNCVGTEFFMDERPMVATSLLKKFDGSGVLEVGTKIGPPEKRPDAILVLDGCYFKRSAAIRAVNLHL
jgi:hypothetical protein